LLIRAVEREIEILGEAARKLDEKTSRQFPSLDFRAIVGMRNIVSHDYRRVRVDVLWETSQEHIPKVIAVLGPYLEKLRKESREQ
jgi:uncharacterized protein with HEPN domain